MTDKYVSGLLKMVPVDIISCFPTLYVYLSLLFFSLSFRRDDHTFKLEHKQQINRLAISPQKNVIAAAGNPCAKLFDIHSSNTTLCAIHSGKRYLGGLSTIGKVVRSVPSLASLTNNVTSTNQQVLHGLRGCNSKHLGPKSERCEKNKSKR